MHSEASMKKKEGAFGALIGSLSLSRFPSFLSSEEKEEKRRRMKNEE